LRAIRAEMNTDCRSCCAV